MTADLTGTLPPAKLSLVEEIVAALSRVEGVVAVALGGSYARGTAKPTSDVDLGVYYLEDHPFRIEDVRSVASRFDQRKELAVTNFYEWGPWVNGGAWLETRVGRIDFIYRNVDHVRRVIEGASRGEIEWHYAQQPPYGFRSVIYFAETSICVPFFDPAAVLARLKESVAVYPEQLRMTIIRSSLWSAEFTLWGGLKYAEDGDVYNAVGCIVRAICELTQVLFALNRVYFISDKGALETIERFALKPDLYTARVTSILARPGGDSSSLSSTMHQLAELIATVADLAKDVYAPKYRLPSRT